MWKINKIRKKFQNWKILLELTDSWYLILNILYLISDTWYLTLDIEYLMSCIFYLIKDIWFLINDAWLTTFYICCSIAMCFKCVFIMGASRVFQYFFKNVLIVFYGCFNGYFKVVSRDVQEFFSDCIKRVIFLGGSSLFQECFKSVSEMFLKCFITANKFIW